MILANLGHLVFNDVDILCIMRIAFGFGSGVNMMVGQVYINETTPIIARAIATLAYLLSVFFGFIVAHICSIIFAY